MGTQAQEVKDRIPEFEKQKEKIWWIEIENVKKDIEELEEKNQSTLRELSNWFSSEYGCHYWRSRRSLSSTKECCFCCVGEGMQLIGKIWFQILHFN